MLESTVKHIHIKLEPDVFTRFDKLLKEDKLKKQEFFEKKVMEFLDKNEAQRELKFK
ncbi:hypothetical protein [Pseudoalteromonas nigrifaciens]|uniref:hypothetical protein n=1 Tax=Pseudoalteromonas nigrifaciens TaxID=28109 RepID=UPI003FCFC811